MAGGLKSDKDSVMNTVHKLDMNINKVTINFLVLRLGGFANFESSETDYQWMNFFT